jgi:hypothetical protein
LNAAALICIPTKERNVNEASMAEAPDKLTPATPEELIRSLVHGLQFDGRKHYRASGELMARITAAHLVEQLEISGYVVMKRPASAGHSALGGPRREGT